MNAPDLTKQAPRSPRVRLGGYVILPRMLDKGRAELAGTNGEYHYGCPLDQHFLRFTGIDPEALKEQLKSGKGDGEILAWIEANAPLPRGPWEIKQWSEYHDNRAPGGDVGTLEFFTQLAKGAGPDRADLTGWFELLDLDDYVSFGGKA